MSNAEKKFAEYLGEVTGVDDYGYLLYNGDPIQFQVGFNDWQRENGTYA